MNVPLIVAGSLALLGAGVHGVAGELLVVRKLSPERLPSTRFGGPRMTRAMVRVTWHMTTVAFLTALLRHPAPIVLTAAALLAWLGAL